MQRRSSTARPSPSPSPSPMQQQLQQGHTQAPSLPPSEVLHSNAFIPAHNWALWGVLVLPLLLWLTCTGLGMTHFPGQVVSSRKAEGEHPLTDFDLYIFRVYGPLLPLGVLCLRSITMLLLRTPPAKQRGGATTGTPPPSLAATALGLYMVLALLRVGLYMGHVLLQHNTAPTPLTLVSDHLFLASCVLACLQAELALLLSDVYKCEAARCSTLRLLGLVGLFLATALLYMAVCADMYFTAALFHHVAESAAAVVAGLAAFQAPLGVWLVRAAHHGATAHGKPPAQPAGAAKRAVH